MGSFCAFTLVLGISFGQPDLVNQLGGLDDG